MADLARLQTNAESVRRRVVDACARAGRDPKGVTILPVTKYVGPEIAAALLDLGFADLAENRAIEGGEKASRAGRTATWHFVGHLQTNKVGKALAWCSWIHSVDRRDLAAALERHLIVNNRRLPSFVQVNVSGEKTKGGLAPAEVPPFLAWASKECPHLEIRGLMTMAPEEEEPERARPVFRTLRELASAAGLRGLSMGMSHDF